VVIELAKGVDKKHQNIKYPTCIIIEV